jgi:hypothetical protein
MFKVNKIEKKYFLKSQQEKKLFFGKINKSDKHLANLTNMRRENKLIKLEIKWWR